MGVRASWHMPVLSPVEDDDDPFAAPIEQVGVPIRLAGDTAELARELVETTHAVRRLADRGVTCAIRALPDTSCAACPIAGTMPELCAVGRRQEEIVTHLAALEVAADA